MFLGQEYAKLTENCEISKLNNDKLVFYYADTNDVQILVRDVLELDIRSAFPTICKIMFGEEHAFVKQIFEQQNKFERNKFIAITLKREGIVDNREYIQELQNYCKMIIFAKVFNSYKDVNILEFKKDGIVFSGGILEDPIYSKIEKVLNDNGIMFGKTIIKHYIRFNRISIFDTTNDGIIIKGTNDYPVFIKEEVLPKLFINPNNFELLNNIKKYYSREFLEILKVNTLANKIKYYYGDGFDINTNPEEVLIGFLYPIISLLRN